MSAQGKDWIASQQRAQEAAFAVWKSRGVSIDDGPNTQDLMTNFKRKPRFDAGPVRFRIVETVAFDPQRDDVVFVAKVATTLEVNIDSLQREDGSGESWNFCGRTAVTVMGGSKMRDVKVHGYFDARRRAGILRFEK